MYTACASERGASACILGNGHGSSKDPRTRRVRGFRPQRRPGDKGNRSLVGFDLRAGATLGRLVAVPVVGWSPEMRCEKRRRTRRAAAFPVPARDAEAACRARGERPKNSRQGGRRRSRPAAPPAGGEVEEEIPSVGGARPKTSGGRRGARRRLGVWFGTLPAFGVRIQRARPRVHDRGAA
jgi:hypothetical protein